MKDPLVVGKISTYEDEYGNVWSQPWKHWTMWHINQHDELRGEVLFYLLRADRCVKVANTEELGAHLRKAAEELLSSDVMRDKRDLKKWEGRITHIANSSLEGIREELFSTAVDAMIWSFTDLLRMRSAPDTMRWVFQLLPIHIAADEPCSIVTKHDSHGRMIQLHRYPQTEDIKPLAIHLPGALPLLVTVYE